MVAQAVSPALPMLDDFCNGLLEIRNIEGLREEVFELIGFGLAVEVGEDQFHVAAKLPEDLAARSTRRGQGIGIGRDGHATEFSDALADGFEDRDALGAE